MRELQLPPTPPGTHDSFSLSDPVALKERLAQAGFVDVHVEMVYAHYEWSSPDAYVEFAQDMLAIVRTTLADLPPERKSLILDAIREAASRYQAQDGTVQADSEAFIVAGQPLVVLRTWGNSIFRPQQTPGRETPAPPTS
jgi:hypothetical protein